MIRETSLTRSAFFMIVASIATAVAITGCGEPAPEMAPVVGKATFEGKPLTAGGVVFHTAEGNAYAGDPPSGLLQVDGTFTVRSFPFGNGVPPGAYKVTLTQALASRIKRPDYADPEKTPLTVTVPSEGVPDLALEIK